MTKTFLLLWNLTLKHKVFSSKLKIPRTGDTKFLHTCRSTDTQNFREEKKTEKCPILHVTCHMLNITYHLSPDHHSMQLHLLRKSQEVWWCGWCGLVIYRRRRKKTCKPFSPNRPLGPFGLVVAMSVPDFVCPLPMQFVCVLGLVHTSLVRGPVHASLALAWSPKNGELFRIGHIIPPNWQFLTVIDRNWP